MTTSNVSAESAPCGPYKYDLQSRIVAGIHKALRLVRGGRLGLLISIPLYRCWWRLRGLDFGVVSLTELGLDPKLANYHKDGGGPLLRDLLNQLQITRDDVALDLGSGKGGAMATMAAYPYRNVDGVEISAELVEASRKNLAKLKLKQCRVFLTDAATFTELDDYTHIFMYNPFPDPVMKLVLANLHASLQRKPRRVRIIYSNPRHEQTILASGRFVKSLDYEPYPDYRICVYENGR